MKKLFTWKNFAAATIVKFVITLCIIGALSFSHAHASPKIGASAPEFSGVDSNGKTVKLSDFKNKIVVLEWKNHECPFVKKHYETKNMQGLQKFAKEKDVVWLSIISSAKGKQGHVDGKTANEIAAKEGSSAAHIILDEKGSIGKLYDAKTTPHMFVVGKDGKLAYMGAIDDKSSMDHEDVKGAKNYVKEALDALLAGKTPEKQATQQYGCSIKY